jgi:hypothetical protein
MRACVAASAVAAAALLVVAVVAAPVSFGWLTNCVVSVARRQLCLSANQPRAAMSCHATRTRSPD